VTPWLNRVVKAIVTSPLDEHCYAGGMEAQDVWRVDASPEGVALERVGLEGAHDAKRLAVDARGRVYVGAFGTHLYWEQDGERASFLLSTSDTFERLDFLTDLKATYSGRYVVALTGQRILRFDQEGALQELHTAERGFNRATINELGEVLVARKYSVLLFDAQGSLASAWDIDGSALHDVQWIPGSRRVAIGHLDGSVSVWDMDAKRELARVKVHAERVAQVSVSPDGRWLASASWDTTIGLLDLSVIDDSPEEFSERRSTWFEDTP